MSRPATSHPTTNPLPAHPERAQPPLPRPPKARLSVFAGLLWLAAPVLWCLAFVTAGYAALNGAGGSDGEGDDGMGFYGPLIGVFLVGGAVSLAAAVVLTVVVVVKSVRWGRNR
jgi:hypothetical protein